MLVPVSDLNLWSYNYTNYGNMALNEAIIYLPDLNFPQINR